MINPTSIRSNLNFGSIGALISAPSIGGLCTAFGTN